MKKNVFSIHMSTLHLDVKRANDLISQGWRVTEISFASPYLNITLEPPVESFSFPPNHSFGESLAPPAEPTPVDRSSREYLLGYSEGYDVAQKGHRPAGPTQD